MTTFVGIPKWYSYWGGYELRDCDIATRTKCDLIFNNCGIVIDAITLVKLVGGNGPKVGAWQGHYV
jgi:hypothetical protein